MKKIILIIGALLLSTSGVFAATSDIQTLTVNVTEVATLALSGDVTMNLTIATDKYTGTDSTSHLDWTCTAASKITATNASAITNAAKFTKVDLTATSITNGTAAAAVDLTTTNSAVDYVTSISAGGGTGTIYYDVETTDLTAPDGSTVDVTFTLTTV